MTRFAMVWWSVGCAALSMALARSQPLPPSVASMDPVQAGALIAERLRAAAPSEPSEFKGSLNIRGENGRTASVPFTMHVTPGLGEWRAKYASPGTANQPAETLVIIHRQYKPSEYLYTRASKPGAAAEQPQPCDPGQLARPFAGSDFWLMDLGLEFFQWPGQRVLKTEMRKGRFCYVLESRNPRPNADYLRVVSWVDKEALESGAAGLIMAEGYGPQDKLLKEFTIRSLKKVQGQWQLQEMEIRNVQARSRTRLDFDFQP